MSHSKPHKDTSVSAQEWWNGFVATWTSVNQSYLDTTSETLDETEKAKLQQRLDQLIVYMEENFHAHFDNLFSNPQIAQEEIKTSIKDKESRLQLLSSQIKDLRSNVVINAQEQYDKHYNDMRAVLLPPPNDDLVIKDKLKKIERPTGVPKLESLKEQHVAVQDLLQQMNKTTSCVKENIAHANVLLASTTQCVKQYTDPQSQNAKILDILRPKRTREDEESADAPARKKIASRFRKKD